MAKTGTPGSMKAVMYGGKKGAATPPYQDIIGPNAKGEIVTLVHKPGDANVKQMAHGTWTPRHMRGKR